MKILTTDDQTTYTGKPADIVKAMAKDSWWAGDPKHEYMAGIAERMELQNGKAMHYTDPASWLKELSERGMIKIV